MIILNKAKLPIGVIDSGIGGLSVMRELVALMPNENYLFFGDSANTPYGTKSVETVRALTFASAERLMKKGIKALVIACNTATAAAAKQLRELHPDMPIIGIEPALKPAVLAKPNPTVIVMATPLTLQQDKFLSLMSKYTDDAHIIPLPCPGLPEIIEGGVFDDGKLDAYLDRLFSPFDKEKIDSIVLGCTHYPLIKNQIAAAFGKPVEIFDGSIGTAKHTRKLLAQANLLNDSENKGNITLLNSDTSLRIRELEEKFLYMKI